MRRVRFFLSVLLLVGALFAPADARAADDLPTVFLDCGPTVWGDGPGEGSFRLGNNLDCPLGSFPNDDVLLVVDDNITVDLGGHRISGPDAAGDGTDSAIVVGSGVQNVVVKNGVIAGYNRAVFVNEATDSRIEGLTIIDSDVHSIVVLNSSRMKIVGNTIIQGTPTNDGSLSIQTSTLGGNNVVSGNVLSGVGMTVTDSSQNTLKGNGVYGGDGPGISVSGDSEETSILKNAVIGTTASAIAVTGGEADENLIQGNTLRGNGVGITIDDGDRNRIIENKVTANGDGISLLNDAKLTTVSKNVASANRDMGVNLQSGVGTRITGNTAIENGGIGIQASVNTDPVISKNRVDHNGYAQGLNNNSILAGVSASSGATGSGNTARGNDASAPSQCLPAELCTEGPSDPPVLTTCQQILTAARTLRNPLVCDTSFRALRISGAGFTVNLGDHVLVGGDGGPTESGLEILNSASSITVKGGVLMDSEHGVFTPTVGAPASKIKISRATIIGNDAEGAFLQGIDPTPNDDVAEAGRHVVKSSTLVFNGASGVLASQAPQNVLTGNTLVGNGTGFDISRSARNVIGSNRLIGNGRGMDISNDGDPVGLPIKEEIRTNRIVGSETHGILANNVIESAISSNTIVGSGVGGQAGISLLGSGSPGGSLDNVISKNRVSGGGGNGMELTADSSENRITSNVVSSHDVVGIVLDLDADDNKLTGNTMDENGASGLVIFNAVLSEVPDIVSDNLARRNGFLSTTSTPNTGDNIGFGLDVANDTDGSGNVAKENDHPDECDPNSFC